MITYRPIAPLTTGRPGLVSALVAMALTAVVGPTWPVSTAAAPDAVADTAGTASPLAAGRNRR
ncbi:hypothetical protein QFZ65_000901 [Arthrobacter sp. B3I9]|uniref:hypothetical protein n=1 Tax=Arthrobacter sp. B3I9 TaxID=3042270 RepID=UPI00278D473E|nr:hypothetical protein [Arthrobacter sp. B3I9]MDQ0848963.1 hypothetical protein [Arthrobacter sp. B3I9]